MKKRVLINEFHRGFFEWHFEDMYDALLKEHTIQRIYDKLYDLIPTIFYPSYMESLI